MYPPEEVEARRWEKIAKGLGTRTAQQVKYNLLFDTFDIRKKNYIFLSSWLLFYPCTT